MAVNRIKVGDRIMLETGRVIDNNTRELYERYSVKENARDRKRYRGRVAIVTSIDESNKRLFRVNVDGGRNLWCLEDVMDPRKFKYQGRYISTDKLFHLLVIDATNTHTSVLCMKEDGNLCNVFVRDIKDIEKAPRVKKVVR